METLLQEVYDAVSATVEPLAPDDFDRPTRAAGWSVRDLLLHQLLDAQRALVALASPTQAAADVDAVTYWGSFRPDLGDGGRAHAAFVRAVAAAYSGPEPLVSQWRETSAAVVRAAGALDGAVRVRTQGHVLTVADLCSSLVVEATVHLLDLTLEVPGHPPAAALAETRRVLEGLYGGPLPAAWDDTRAALRGTGREHVGPEVDPDRFPLLG